MVNPSQLAFLPSLSDPGAQQAFLDWAGYHAQWHRAIQQQAVRDGHLDLGTYDVADIADFEDFLYFHNQEHQNISETYNMQAPPDLSFWDRQDPVNDPNWLSAHAQVHQNIQQALNL